MTAAFFLAQRLSAIVLAFAVVIHIGTILYAVRGGLTATEILGRTRGNAAFLTFYTMFVVAVSVHAPIGLRNILREWGGCRGITADLTTAMFALLLLLLGFRSVYAVYAS